MKEDLSGGYWRDSSQDENWGERLAPAMRIAASSDRRKSDLGDRRRQVRWRDERCGPAVVAARRGSGTFQCRAVRDCCSHGHGIPVDLFVLKHKKAEAMPACDRRVGKASRIEMDTGSGANSAKEEKRFCALRPRATLLKWRRDEADFRSTHRPALPALPA
jgi:hypothetical protein